MQYKLFSVKDHVKTRKSHNLIYQKKKPNLAPDSAKPHSKQLVKNINKAKKSDENKPNKQLKGYVNDYNSRRRIKCLS